MNENHINEEIQKAKRSIRVHLPESFILTNQECLLKLLFSNKKRTGGDTIVSFKYMPSDLVALVEYESEEVVERVYDFSPIKYSDFVFNISKVEIKEEKIEHQEQEEKKEKEEAKPDDQSSEKPKKSRNRPRKNKKISQDNDFRFERPLKTNLFLSFIVSDKNKQWKEELIKFLNEKNLKMEAKNHKLTITRNSEVDDAYESKNEWMNKVNVALNTYLVKYKMEKINSQDKAIIDEVIDKIEKIKPIACMDYKYVPEEKNLYVISEKDIIDNFTKNLLMPLMKKSDEPKSNEQEPIKSEILKIPPSTNMLSSSEIVYSVVSYMKEKFNLMDVSLSPVKRQITLNGYKTDVSNALNEFKKCFDSIVCKSILKLNLPKSKYQSLNNIINDCLAKHLNKDKILYYKLKLDNSRDTYCEIFVTYFRNYPELNAGGDSTFLTIFSCINKYLISKSIETSLDNSFFLTSKWKQFEQKNLNKTVCGNKFFFYLKQEDNSLMSANLFGFIDEVCKIEQLLIEILKSDTQFKPKSIKLPSDDMVYLKYVAYDFKKDLEANFNIKIDFENNLNNAQSNEDFTNLIISNCQDTQIGPVEELIKLECKKRKTKLFKYPYVTGIEKIMHKNNTEFKDDVLAIMKSTRTFISYYLKVVTLEKEVNDKPQVSNLSGLRNYIEIGKSRLNLEVGKILKIPAQIIVNQTSNQYKNESSASNALYKIGGMNILDDLKKSLPNGIPSQYLVVTKPGKINNVNYLFHIGYFNTPNEIHEMITKCLTKLKELNFNSISFSAPEFNKPLNIDTVSAQVIRSCVEYLKQNPNHNFSINIVVFDMLTRSEQSLQKAMSEFQKANNLASNSTVQQIIKKESTKIKYDSVEAFFKIIYKNDDDSRLVEDGLRNLISNEYIKTDSLNDIRIKLDMNEIKKLKNEFEKLYIFYRNDKLEFKGFRDDVFNAKIKAAEMINNLMRNKFKNLSVTAELDVEWFYEELPNQWAPFSVELSKVIEETYLSKTHKFIFKNELNADACIYFNTDPMQYTFMNNRYNVKRIENNTNSQNSNIPKCWKRISLEEGFNLVQVREGTLEYEQALSLIASEYPANQIRTFKIQRIENKFLIEKYTNYIEVLKTKGRPNSNNINEMRLFHEATDIDTINRVCRFGFNKSYCSLNDNEYGNGVNFNKFSSPCLNKLPSDQTEKRLFMCRVLLGQYLNGHKSMIYPPKRADGQFYDSTCDNTKNPKVFVCFNENQSFPEYLITLTLNGDIKTMNPSQGNRRSRASRTRGKKDLSGSTISLNSNASYRSNKNSYYNKNNKAGKNDNGKGYFGNKNRNNSKTRSQYGSNNNIISNFNKINNDLNSMLSNYDNYMKRIEREAQNGTPKNNQPHHKRNNHPKPSSGASK